MAPKKRGRGQGRGRPTLGPARTTLVVQADVHDTPDTPEEEIETPPARTQAKRKPQTAAAADTVSAHDDRDEGTEADDDLSDSQVDSQEQTKKKSRVHSPTVVLTLEQEDDVASWWQSHEFLYRKGCKEYRDAPKRKTKVQQKAAELDLTCKYTHHQPISVVWPWVRLVFRSYTQFQWSIRTFR